MNVTNLRMAVCCGMIADRAVFLKLSGGRRGSKAEILGDCGTLGTVWDSGTAMSADVSRRHMESHLLT